MRCVCPMIRQILALLVCGTLFCGTLRAEQRILLLKQGKPAKYSRHGPKSRGEDEVSRPPVRNRLSNSPRPAPRPLPPIESERSRLRQPMAFRVPERYERLPDATPSSQSVRFSRRPESTAATTDSRWASEPVTQPIEPLSDVLQLSDRIAASSTEIEPPPEAPVESQPSSDQSAEQSPEVPAAKSTGETPAAPDGVAEKDEPIQLAAMQSEIMRLSAVEHFRPQPAAPSPPAVTVETGLMAGLVVSLIVLSIVIIVLIRLLLGKFEQTIRLEMTQAPAWALAGGPAAHEAQSRFTTSRPPPAEKQTAVADIADTFDSIAELGGTYAEQWAQREQTLEEQEMAILETIVDENIALARHCKAEDNH